MSYMRIFAINLEKNVSRLSRLRKKLDAMGIPFERFNAVYGECLSEKEIAQKVNKLHWWSIKGYMPRRGEIGAALSHQGVYRKMALEGIKICCVFEDDISPDKRLGAQLRNVKKWMDVTRPQVVLLSNYTKTSSEVWAITPSDGDSSAEAYVLTGKAAEILVHCNTPVCAPADYWVYWRKKGIELYHAFPSVVHPDWIHDSNYTSDVTPCGSVTLDVRHMNIFLLLMWKLNRLCGKLLGRLLYGD